MSYPGPYPLPIIGGGTAQTTSPSFAVYLSAPVSNATGDGTNYIIAFDTKIYDTTSSYNTGTHAYTVPVTGNYIFSLTTSLSSVGAAHTLGYAVIQDNSSNVYTLWAVNPGTSMTINNTLVQTGSVCVSLTSGLVVNAFVVVSNSTKTVGVNGGALTVLNNTFFSGYLVK